MRSLAVLVLLAVLAGCASAPPEPTPTSPSAGTPAAPASATESLLTTAVPYADHPQVQDVFGAEVQEALLEGTLEVVLFEEDRDPLPDERAVLVPGQGDDLRPVVQSAQVEDREARRTLLGAVYRALAEHGRTSAHGCFIPHHLILAEHGATRVEVVVCLLCESLIVYRNGSRVGGERLVRAALVPAFEALVGPRRERSFEGRTLREWWARLGTAGQALARGEVATVDTAGVLLLGRAAGWGIMCGPSSLGTLHGLGAAAAPAVPELARLLEATRETWLRKALLQTLQAIGPASAPALPAIERLAEDEAVGARARILRDRLRAATGLAPASPAIPFADARRVQAVLPPDLQELLLEGALEVAVVQSRAVAPGERAIEGYPVVRSVTLPDRASRAALLAGLYEGLEEAPSYEDVQRAPRYAVEARLEGRRLVLLLDVYVSQLHVVVDGVRAPRVQLWDTARPALEELLAGDDR